MLSKDAFNWLSMCDLMFAKDTNRIIESIYLYRVSLQSIILWCETRMKSNGMVTETQICRNVPKYSPEKEKCVWRTFSQQCVKQCYTFQRTEKHRIQPGRFIEAFVCQSILFVTSCYEQRLPFRESWFTKEFNLPICLIDRYVCSLTMGKCEIWELISR